MRGGAIHVREERCPVELPWFVLQLNPERVVQWTRMHFSIGIDHFLFFDAGAIDKAMRKELLVRSPACRL